MTVNHDQQSMVSLHPDGSPVQTTLSLTFKEIEFLISGDSKSADDKARSNLSNRLTSSSDKALLLRESGGEE